MKKLVAAALFVGSMQANAGTFTGTDFSGSYDCTGNDQHDGKFKGTITLQLVRAQSNGEYGSYNLTFEAEGFGGYTGYAAAHGTHMALQFANKDLSTKDYGNSIVTFSKTKSDKWQFESFYYEPEYYGGNFGSETCVMR
ncbi:MAG: hypothetical protein QM709_08660 [Spongiibacteraceae bacterium]